MGETLLLGVVLYMVTDTVRRKVAEAVEAQLIASSGATSAASKVAAYKAAKVYSEALTVSDLVDVVAKKYGL